MVAGVDAEAKNILVNIFFKVSGEEAVNKAAQAIKQFELEQTPAYKTAKKVAESFRLQEEQAKLLAEKMALASNKTNTFSQVMGMSNEKWVKFNKSGQTFIPWSGKFANAIRMFTTGLRGFRMEMLSVMFFGMGLVSIMKSLISPAFEATGIFELLSATLQIVFLPIAMVLLELLLPILEWFMNLPEGAKLAIGVFVLLAGAIGFILTALGSLSLGMGGLIMVFGPLIAGLGSAGSAIAGAVSWIIAAIAGLTAPIALIIAAIVLVIVGIIYAWDKVVKAAKDFVANIIAAVTLVWEGIKKIFGGIIDFIVGVFTGDWDRAWGGLKKIASGFLDVIWGLFKIPLSVATFGWDLIKAIATGIWNAAVDLGKAIYGLPFIGPILKGVFTFISDITSKFYDFGAGIIKSLVSGIKSIASTVLNALYAIPFIGPLLKAGGILASKAINFVGKYLPEFANGGIVQSPTVGLLGEAGPEAVIPLSQLSKITNNNTPTTINVYANVSSSYDVNALADELSRKMGLNVNRSSYL